MHTYLVTGTMPLATQILRTATNWRATSQMIHRNMLSDSPLCDDIKSYPMT